jgi:hypothetical protein
VSLEASRVLYAANTFNDLTLSCNISKVKPAEKAAKHLEKLWKISVHTQKISSQQIEYRIDMFNDLSSTLIY